MNNNKKQMPSNRFAIRPNIDPADTAAMDELVGGIVGWIKARRAAVRAEMARERAREV